MPRLIYSTEAGHLSIGDICGVFPQQGGGTWSTADIVEVVNVHGPVCTVVPVLIDFFYTIVMHGGTPTGFACASPVAQGPGDMRVFSRLPNGKWVRGETTLVRMDREIKNLGQPTPRDSQRFCLFARPAPWRVAPK